MKNLKGYIFSRPFYGERAPQHIQNIVIKDYCKKKNYGFLLSATEYSSSKSDYILFELLENLKNYDGLVFYSFLQLPSNFKRRSLLYKKILGSKKEIHFAVENFSAKNKKEIEEIEKIFQTNQIIQKPAKFGKEKSYVSYRHNQSKRNYLDRMIDDKINCMKISKKYGKDYWDGDRRYGYGGYKYIKGYHKYLAENLIKDYNLNKDSKILDIGCGKGYLMYELSQILKNENIFGCDVSNYAIKNAKKEMKKNIFNHDARKKFKFKNNEFNLVFSNTTLHNFKIPEVFQTLSEIERIGLNKYVCVESYRNEKEQFNLQCWALTAETLIDKKSWTWLFNKSGYTGDYEFIYFK